MLKAHDAGRWVVRWLRCLEIIALLIALLPQLAKAADQTLLLDVQLNGNSLGKIGEFTLRGGALLTRRSELRELGIRGPISLVPRGSTSLASEAEALIVLSDLPGLTWRIDMKSQTLYVTASKERLLPTLLQVDAESEIHGELESGTGVTLNYDIASTFAGYQKNAASGSLNLRAFSPWGIASSGLLAYAGASTGGRGTNTTIRLDSTYTFADAGTQLRYAAGDFITGSLSWTRPVRLGGAQVRSDFSMRPDLVTFPLPSVSGSVAVPSTVNVLANGNLVLSRQIDAGPFEIPQLPVITGAGMISMTVTNSLGQQVSVTQPFYASSSLLAPGLQTYSAQVGVVRRNWGVVSNDYGNFAGTAIYRRGLTRSVTVEGSAEGTEGTVMAGGGVVVKVGNLGVLNVDAAGSTGSGRTGTQFSVGSQRIGTKVSLGASVTMADRNFRDIAAANGDPVPRLQVSANAGLSLRRFGSVGIAYAGIDRDIAPNPVLFYVTPAQHSHVLSASYSVQVHKISIYATEFQGFSSKGESGVMVGLTVPLGRRSSIGGSLGSGGGYGQMQAQQSAVSIGDWGYQAYVSAGSPSHEFIQSQYKSPWALLTSGVDSVARQTSLRLESQGAVSFADGRLFASNTVNDSFAIVDTRGLGNVRVLQENRSVGSTNSGGRLLVPDLRSFDVNRIAIEPTDIPLDTTIAVTAREVRPQDRSGVVVKFRMMISHGALLRLVDEAGTPVTLGSTAKLRATGAIVPVGYDGEAYVQDLSPHNEIAVERLDGHRCYAVFDYKAIAGEIPTIGPLRCREQKP